MAHPDGERRGYIIDRLSGKVSKEDANYRPAEHDTKESCAECHYYTAPGEPQASCRRVAGSIQGDLLCDYFEARKEEGSQSGVNININIGKG